MPSRNRVNMIGTVSYLMLNVVTGLLLTPVLIRYLGVESFGYISLSTSIVSYLSLLTFSIQGSLGRFLAISVTTGNVQEAREYFNSGFWGIAGILLFLTCALGVALGIFCGFGTASSHAREVWSLMVLVIVAFVITTIASVFLLSAFVNNRLEIKSLCESLGLLVRASVTLLLVTLLSPRLASVGWAFVCGAAVLLLASVQVWRKMTPDLVLGLNYLSAPKLRELAPLSWWMLVNQVGTLLFLQVEVVVAGCLLGPRLAGIYAALLVFVTLLRSLARAIVSSLVPTFLEHVAKNETAAIVKLALQTETAMGLAVALPVGLVIAFGKPILMHWLGRQFVQWSPLLVIMVLHLVLNLAVLPLFNINVALNKIKGPAQVTLLLGTLNVVLMTCLGSDRVLGLYGIAAASAITLSLKNFFYTPWYASRILGVRSRQFYLAIVPGAACSCIIALLGLGFATVFDVRYLQCLLSGIFAICISYAAVTFRFLSGRLREAK